MCVAFLWLINYYSNFLPDPTDITRKGLYFILFYSPSWGTKQIWVDCTCLNKYANARLASGLVLKSGKRWKNTAFNECGGKSSSFKDVVFEKQTEKTSDVEELAVTVTDSSLF